MHTKSHEFPNRRGTRADSCAFADAPRLVAVLLVALMAAASPAFAGQSDDFVGKGMAALDRGDVAAAREFFDRALAQNPNDVVAHTNLGIVADRVGDLEKAMRHFAEAARLGPSATTHNNYGVILLRSGRTREAASQLEASLALDPKQPNALVNLAQIRFSGGTADDLRSAQELLSRAFAIAPDAGIAHALTVVALRREDRVAAAASYKEYAARGSGGSIAPAVRAELGGALLEAGLLSEAEAELNAAVALEPTHVEAVVRLARVHLARNDVPAAGRTLESAVARGLDAAPVYAALAEVYEKSGHLENAIPAMRLAIQRDSTSEKYRFAYGMLLTNAYAPAAAVIRLEEALALFPDSPRLWFALGLAHFKHDKDAEATRALERAVALDPKFAPAVAYLGVIRVKGGAVAEGVARYEEALRIDPGLAVVHYLVAEALLKEPEADESRIESNLRRAVALDGTFVPARLSLAKFFIRAQRWADAAAELEQATKLDPNVAEAYYHLGRVYGRLKRDTDARTAVATFKRLNDTQKEHEETELREIVRRLTNVRF
jgi:Tfp pilus assembly protein PilF